MHTTIGRGQSLCTFRRRKSSEIFWWTLWLQMPRHGMRQTRNYTHISFGSRRVNWSITTGTLFQERRYRERYFLGIPRTGDLFLDPDTGIKTRGSTHEKYLLPRELFELIEPERDRLVIVYQHSAHGSKMHDRVKRVLAKLAEQKRPFSCSSYESNTVALLFFSMTAERTQSVRDCFARLTRGTDAANRIGFRN